MVNSERLRRLPPLDRDILAVDAIKNYRIPPEKEDYEIPVDATIPDVPIDPILRLSDGPDALPRMKSNLRLFPPPLFSRQLIPQIYKLGSLYIFP